MKTVRALIKKHPVLSYFALAFAVSWGVVLLVVGPGGILGTPEQFKTLLPFTVVAMLAGPSLAGILLTGLVHGRTGFRDLLSRLFKWRANALWYVVALFAAPFLVTALLLVFSLFSPEFLPGIFTSEDKVALLLSGLAAGLVVGIFEELGWTGFAVPMLRLRYGILASGLIVGALWGAWHFLVTFWGSGTSSGTLSLDIFLPGVLFAVGVLPAYRVLMVWVYDRTGSLLLAMLMHASLTASTVFILAPPVTGVPQLAYNLVLTAALWIIAAAVAVANGGHLSRRQLRKRVA